MKAGRHRSGSDGNPAAIQHADAGGGHRETLPVDAQTQIVLATIVIGHEVFRRRSRVGDGRALGVGLNLDNWPDSAAGRDTTSL